MSAGKWEDASRVLYTWPQTVRAVNMMCEQFRERKRTKKVQGKVSRIQENVVRDGDFTGGMY